MGNEHALTKHDQSNASEFAQLLHNYWLVVWNIFIFHILLIVIPTDYDFSEGLKPPTSFIVDICGYIENWTAFPTNSSLVAFTTVETHQGYGVGGLFKDRVAEHSLSL